MKKVKLIIKILNITFLLFVFVLSTTSIINVNVSLPCWGIDIPFLRNCLYYPFFLLFTLALVQYIRLKAFGWYNYFLSSVGIYIGFVLLMSVVLIRAIWSEFISNPHQNSLLFNSQIVEDLICSKGASNLQEGALANPILESVISTISLNILMLIIGLSLCWPYAVLMLYLISKNYIHKKYKNRFIGLGLVFIIITTFLAIYNTFFGEFTSSAVQVYLTASPLDTNTQDIAFGVKMNNLVLVKDDILGFVSKLKPNLYYLLITIFLILGFEMSILNKKLNY